MARNIFILKITLKTVAGIVFDLRNESDEIWGCWTKTFLSNKTKCQFRLILYPHELKIENFGQNRSPRAGKLATFV
jgi:hypothetical protein